MRYGMNDIEETLMTAEQMKKTMLDGLRAKGWNRAYAFVEKQEDPADIRCAYVDYTKHSDDDEFRLMQFFLEVS